MYYIIGKTDLKEFIFRVAPPHAVLTRHKEEARKFMDIEQAERASKELSTKIHKDLIVTIEAYDSGYILYCRNKFSLMLGYFYCCTLKELVFVKDYWHAKRYDTQENAEQALEKYKKIAERQKVDIDVIRIVEEGEKAS